MGLPAIYFLVGLLSGIILCDIIREYGYALRIQQKFVLLSTFKDVIENRKRIGNDQTKTCAK